MGIYGGTYSPAPLDTRADCHNAGQEVAGDGAGVHTQHDARGETQGEGSRQRRVFKRKS